MINHVRAMTYFYKQILGLAVKTQIAIKMGSLRLPVKPDGAIAAIKNVIMNLCIERSVKLNACNFRTVIRLLMMDMVNSVSVDFAEYGAQMTDNCTLFTLKDLIIADDMAADMLLVPVAVHSAENDLLFALRAKLELQIRPLVVAR